MGMSGERREKKIGNGNNREILLQKLPIRINNLRLKIFFVDLSLTSR